MIIDSLAGCEPALSAAEHLHALALFDGRQLLEGRWDLGALYLQPELRGARLEPFWSDQERLRLHYLALSRAIVAETGVDDAAADLLFRLVESLVNMWTNSRARNGRDCRNTLRTRASGCSACRTARRPDCAPAVISN